MIEKPLICIIGAGRTGRILVDRMRAAWRLVVVDINIDKLNQIHVDPKHKHDIELIEGDAGSYLTLEKAGVAFAYQVLVTINDDLASEEIVHHLKKRFKFKNIFARINNQKLAETLRNQGVFVVTPYETMANMIMNQMNFGETIALNIGKGMGEIVQIELTRSSPIVGKSLKDLPPKQWIIGAIYRPKRKLNLNSALSYFRNFEVSKEDQFIIPNGDTVPKTGDKVILIGDPLLLRSTAQYLKAGASVFPKRHGDIVLVISLDRKSPVHLQEQFAWLLTKMEPTKLLYLSTDESLSESIRKIDYPKSWPDEFVESVVYESTPRTQLKSNLKKLFSHNRFGLIVYREPATFLNRNIHRIFFQKRIIKRASRRNSPIWIIKGGQEKITGITIFVSDADGSLSAAELALDAAKKFNLPIQAFQVNSPKEITGNEQMQSMKNAMQSVREIAALYGLPIKANVHTGNPVYEPLKHISTSELLVLSYPLNKKKGFLTPPIAERLLLRKYKGSILLLPI